MNLYQRSQAEIEDLHRRLFEWCRGQVSNNEQAWERINRSWATGFRLADAEGLVEGSKRLLRLQTRFNEKVDDPLRAVWIEGFTGYAVADDLFQAFYEEWQAWDSGRERGRAWSVLLRDVGEALEWVHAHRSWLSDDAKPSFRPPEAFADAPAADLEDGEPDDVPWARSAPALDLPPPPEPAPAADPVTEIRAFFGDSDLPVFDQHDPDNWLRTLRKGGPEAVLRAGLVVLEHLLGPWARHFPDHPAPGRIHEALTRYQRGDAQALADAKALVEAAQQSATTAKTQPPDPSDDYRANVLATNAAEAAARLAAGADGSEVALAVKLSPVLNGLTEPTRLALRPKILAAFA